MEIGSLLSLNSVHLYFVYITTNPQKTVLYTGVTNSLYRRMYAHRENRNEKKTFTGRYYCYNLIYYEEFECIVAAIEREKQIKGLRREKKERLINESNPNWDTIQFPE